ncbi:MAG: carboxypeptidase M32, partial [Gammaproteobacteria bacterium]
MLSPAEELGLAGAALDARVRRAVNHIPDATLHWLSRRLADDARLNGVVYERAGEIEPVRIMLRPLLVMPEQVTYLHNVCTVIVDALKRLPELYFSDPDVRAILPLAADEEAWLRDCWTALEGGQNALYGRLDAVCDFTGARWQDSLQFLEPNLSGVGGIQLGPLADSLVVRDIVPTIIAHDPGLTIDQPRDQRDLFLQVLLDHARAVGRTGRNICLVEPKYEMDGPNEQSAMAQYFRERHGVTVVHADPTELRLTGDEVWYQDTCIDVAYRDYEMRDLLELERETGSPLLAMRALFRQNRMVSSAGGDFDHKSCWELFTDDRLVRRHFTNRQRLLFQRHILWTRILSNRTTSLPRGRGDLPKYAREFREHLVLKPNRGYGGEGVHVGALTPQAEWEDLLAEALRVQDDPAGSWVVQAVANLPVQEFPVVDDDGRVHYEPFYSVLGFTPTDHGLAMLCRVSQKQVVNVAQHGGLAPVLIGYPPDDLRAPIRAAVPQDVAVKRLTDRIQELRDLDAVVALMDWDEETLLPTDAHERRGQQMGTVETIAHDLLVDDALGDLIEEVSALTRDDPLRQAELAELKRTRRIELAVPHDLVGALAEARSLCLAAWEAARKSGKFADFAGPFAGLLTLVRERARALQRGGDLYDGLLDEYEPGMTRARLDPLLRDLGNRLRELVPVLAERTSRKQPEEPLPALPEAVQESFCRALLADMGFSLARGRVDRSTHPFTTMIGEDDVRLTLRYQADNPLSAIFAALHEGGHALYDQGFPAALQDTLLAEAPSTGLHESQARLWENHVGRSAAFWTHYLPRLQARLPAGAAPIDPARFRRAVNIVRPTLVRVEADEVSYNLHILMRYELETALLSGDLAVKDLPGAWNDASRKWLGIVPSTLNEGCLQDVHWAGASIGYFPTYTLGNLYAAQLAEAYAARADLTAELAGGNLRPLRDWLAENVYCWGCQLEAEEIVRRATGRG